jgi:hypothetical protein
METARTIVVVWFMCSVLIEVIGNAVFYYWLRRKGIPLSSLFAGTPGYLDWVYVRWSRERHHSPKRLLLMRALSLMNMVAAAVVFISMMRATS